MIFKKASLKGLVIYGVIGAVAGKLLANILITQIHPQANLVNCNSLANDYINQSIESFSSLTDKTKGLDFDQNASSNLERSGIAYLNNRCSVSLILLANAIVSENKEK